MKKEKEVIISVVGTQTGSNGEGNPIELVTEGKFYNEGNGYTAVYKETRITGMDGTVTTVAISPEIVILTREGSVNSQLIFEKGQRHVSHYDTAHGAFTIGVFTNTMFINVNEHGGELKIDYHLEIDNADAGTNDFHMIIREVDSDEC
ncbi:MAG: DUF1934 domain-containing protein [Deltaproteobacteria bacterium]